MSAGLRAGQAARCKLPIGIQTFRTIREEGCYYVDKTPFIERLLGGGARMTFEGHRGEELDRN